MRTTPLTAALLLILATGLHVPAAHAQNQAPRCQGLKATIVNTDGGVVLGTEGNDVIVVTAPDATADVDAGGGDDTVCLNVRDATATAGSGADVIQVLATTGSHLNAMGDAEDSLIVSSDGSPGLWFGSFADRFVRHDEQQVVDFVGFTTLEFRIGRQRLSALGSETADRLIVSAGRVDVDMRGGDDQVLLGTRGTVPRNVVVRGGHGSHDTVSIAVRSSVDLDLRHQMIYTRGNPTWRAFGTEAYRLSARSVFVQGSRSRNDVAAMGCRVEMHGGYASDILRAAPRAFGPVAPKCSSRRYFLYGDQGGDTLVGWSGADRLIGGHGREDVARGRGGVDTCRAESRTNCER